MKPLPKVEDFMSRDLATLSPEMEINHAMHVLLDRGLSGAPVLDANGSLVGVLSQRDCLKAALQASYFRDWEGTVGSYMSGEVETLDPGMDLIAAAEAFVDSRFRRFPVVLEGCLVGQISRVDVLRGLSENWQ